MRVDVCADADSNLISAFEVASDHIFQFRRPPSVKSVVIKLYIRV